VGRLVNARNAVESLGAQGDGEGLSMVSCLDLGSENRSSIGNSGSEHVET
jgi:hypothetical protein